MSDFSPEDDAKRSRREAEMKARIMVLENENNSLKENLAKQKEEHESGTLSTQCTQLRMELEMSKKEVRVNLVANSR
jgi:hypothetical protein